MQDDSFQPHSALAACDVEVDLVAPVPRFDHLMHRGHRDSDPTSEGEAPRGSTNTAHQSIDYAAGSKTGYVETKAYASILHT